ncbi:MAG: TonB-dependent receptor [Sterolibacteriaceae bacterium]|nr:TonB-dependent receptor [Sterolibacteriaceae bacterium]
MPDGIGYLRRGAQDVAGLSLEDLLNTEVSTVSRKSQRLSQTAAAVFVLTGEDIQRSSATSIPEAPARGAGCQVARMGNTRWAVSARGFNGRFANKLLVQMDGPLDLLAGVLRRDLGAEDSLIEDIDRIEVIRGPGAALWGLTRSMASSTSSPRKRTRNPGGRATVSAGSEGRVGGSLRWGRR